MAILSHVEIYIIKRCSGVVAHREGMFCVQ